MSERNALVKALASIDVKPRAVILVALEEANERIEELETFVRWVYDVPLPPEGLISRMASKVLRHEFPCPDFWNDEWNKIKDAYEQE